MRIDMTSRPSVANGLKRSAARFVKAQDGSVTLFGLFMFMMMILVGGIGVDLMRNEMERTRVQATLDRAVLAAADLDQPLVPEAVVQDYFNKSNLAHYTPVTVADPGANFRFVTSSVRGDTPTRFMHLMGVNDLPISSRSAASQIVPNIEISLVLDISGSMRFSDRMTELRPAAVGFIDAVLQDEMQQYTSINLIPYAGQTNVGPFMFNRLNGNRYADIELLEEDGGTESDRYPNVSSCLELNGSDFGYPGLPNGTSYQQTPHFMNWNIAASVMDWGWCPQDATSIKYATNVRTGAAGLNTLINSMRMHDGTGTHYAMKYALALLDPASQPHFAAMAGAGIIPPEFSNRPAAWNDAQSAKYIVLMTDGQITEQVRPDDWMDQENPTIELSKRSGDRDSISSASTNVSRFYAICDLAKSTDRNVVIYTIAFEAPSSAQTQMRNCASTPSHYFNVEGNQLNDVFQAIARQVQQLKLTQ